MNPPLATVRSDRDADDRVLVVVRGEVDMSNAEEVGDRIDAVVGAGDAVGGGPTVVVDLAEIRYLDTSGVRILGELGRRLRERLVLVAPPGSVARDVLSVTGLDAHLVVVAARPGS